MNVEKKYKQRTTLVLGPAKQTKGGIASVIKAQEETDTWQKWNCKWIETFTDRSVFHKMISFVFSLIKFLYLLPGAGIVHIHFSEPTSAYRKSFFVRTAKLFNKKVVLHFHSFSPETTLFGPKSKLYEKLLSMGDRIIVLSQFWKDQIQKVVHSENKISIIYNPCPRINSIGSGEKEKTILYAGILNKRKGYLDLLEAFCKIAHLNKDWKVVFAGNGEIEKGKAFAKNNNISDQVQFKGWVSGKEKEELFKTASIFCLPSYAEGFPMSVVEAWAYGLPVITTPVGGLPDVLEHKNNAMVFEPGDISLLSEHIKTLLSDVKLREKISAESIKLSQGAFNIHTFDVELDRVYKAMFV